MSSRYSGGVIRKNQLVPNTSSASGVWDLNEATQSTKSDIWPYSGIANPISQSLRIRRANSAYLQRTPATQTNRSTWTYSFWHKRGSYNGNSQGLINAGTGSNIDTFTLDSNDRISIDINNATRLVSTQRFRDSSAWYHFVWYYDATQGTASNRMKVYVNGVEITAFDTDTRSSISSATSITNTTVAHRIGYYDAGILYTDGYMADVNFIDGQALDPSYFGQTSAITGVWEPKQYSGTYGTNGWHLEFKDTTVGQDTSGNNNDWTPNNISTTLNYTNDLVKDVPTQWAPRDGSANVRGNYCTLNPVDRGTSDTLTDGNLNYNNTSTTAWNGARSTFIVPKTGEWYWEAYIRGTPMDVGLCLASAKLDGTGSPAQGYNQTGSYSYGALNSAYRYSGNDQAAAPSYTVGDTISYYVNAGVVSVYKNNSLVGTWSQNLSAQSGDYFASVFTNSTDNGVAINFGQRPFTYTPPGSAKALCTTNLPTPTIGATVATTTNKYFDAKLWTGDAVTPKQVVTGLAFQPDFIWTKTRSIATQHALYDAVRGVGSGKILLSNESNAEGGTGGTSDATYGYMSAINSDGFTTTKGSSDTNYFFNNSGETYVAWNWNAGGSTVTNTSGTISAQVRANPTAGFSIVTYTATAADPITVGHGLGVAPNMFFVKSRSAAGTDWFVYHSSLGATKNLRLNGYAAAATATNVWNDTAPTSSVITTSNAINTNGVTYVAYCFAQIAGYSAFGSYTGTGSTNGPFVYCGFRPRWIMIKNSTFAGTTTSNWFIRDTSRDTYNPANKHLWADLSVTESNASYAASQYENLDILSNGFKLRNDNGGTNRSGDTMIYAAFAEFPFKTTLAR